MIGKKDIKNFLRSTRDFIIGDIFRVNTTPDFLIVGAQKSGTTSLAYYLSQHPEVQLAYAKEVGYFTSTKYRLGDKWYRKQFPARFKKVKYFEATPDYMYIDSFAERLYKYNRDIQIVVILRNPVDRAYSAWNMFKGIHGLPEEKKNKIINNFIIYGEDKKSVDNFINFLKAEEYPDFSSYIKMELDMIKQNSPLLVPGFLRYGIYHKQIERLLKYFDKKHILILENGELKNDKKGTMNKIFDFLKIPYSDKINLNEKGARIYTDPMSSEDRQLLIDFYKDYNQKLFDLIGKKYNWDR